MTRSIEAVPGRAEWQTQEQYEWGVQYRAKREAARRSLATKFKVWRDCAHKSCQRAQACCGADHRCLFTFFRSLSDHERLYLQKLIAARRAGFEGEAAIRAAQEAFFEALARQEEAFRATR